MTNSDNQTAQMLGIALAAIVAVWVTMDAMRRGRSSGEALLWGLGVFCLCIAVLPAYLIGRTTDSPDKKARQSTLCRYCGLYNEGDPYYCAHCGKQIKAVGGPPDSSNS